MCDAATARKLLIVFNVVFLAGGAALLGFGLWMKFDPNIVHFLNIVNVANATPLLNYAAVIFIISGGVVLFISAIGCVGAIKSSQALLFVYALLVLVAMAAEIVGGALALTYRTKMEGNLTAAMTFQVKMQYMPGQDAWDSWNYLQNKMKCCGASNFTDYEGSAWRNSTDPKVRNATSFVPTSCCDPEKFDECQMAAKSHDTQSEALFTKGCSEAVVGWFENHTLIMMILGFAIGGCQIFAFLTACCLRNALKTLPNKYT